MPSTGLVLGFNASRWERLRGADPWLLLQFTVPCGKRLRPYKRNGTACGLADVAGLNRGAQLEPQCPQDENVVGQQSVVVLLDATMEMGTYVYHLRQDGGIARLDLEQCDCIFMEAGVFWVDGTVFRERPPEYELRAWLLHSAQPPDAPMVQTWRRERHVLALMARERMRLELLFERGMTESQVSVGVDDVQLTPVLSSFPALVGAEGRRCARVRVPTAQELADIGLGGLFLGNHNVSHDDWERVQGTVGLDVRAQSAVGCSYSVKLSLVRDDCPGDASEPGDAPEPGDASGRLENLGCKLELTLGGMGAYDECQIELPAYLAQNNGDQSVGIVLVPLKPDAACTLPEDSSFVVSLRPHTKLYSCPLGEFLHADGACTSCHRRGVHEQCAPGLRLRGCPALELPSGDNCVQCTEGHDLVEQGVAEYVTNFNSTVPCDWKCSEGYFMFRQLGVRECMNCSQVTPCEPGTQWRTCGANEDAGCVPCPLLWLTNGPYADNEEYFDHANTCQTRCKADYYRSRRDNLCKKCWDKTQLLLMAGAENTNDVGYYFFRNCTANLNTQMIPCTEKEGSDIVSHDPGFTGDCARTCKKGWRPVGNNCTRCEDPPLVANGEVQSTQFLPMDSFEWKSNSTDLLGVCDFECKHPYSATWQHSDWQDGKHERTCVRCSDVCEIGQFPVGPYCECDMCEM